MTNTEIIDCTTCKYGYEDERLGIPMCHHPKRFSEDCVDFNMHEEKEIQESEKPMEQDGLEEEIREYMSNEDNNPFDWDWRDKRDCARHFAKWGAEHTHLPEDTVLFNKDVAEGKRLMLEEAVEGEVENASLGIIYLRKNLVNEGYSTGDKVRIIVIPNTDEK